MKAFLATMMIALAVTFTGCGGGDDAATDDAPADEEPMEEKAE